MAAVARRAAFVLALTSSCAAWALAADPAAAPAPSAPAAETAAAVDPAAELQAAETAFAGADFDAARDHAKKALAALETATGDDTPERRRARARALDILAVSYFQLGDKTARDQAIDRLIKVDPGYRVDPATSGPKYLEMFEAHRKKLVGYIVPTCSPAACETIAVDGRPTAVDGEGRVAVLAGDHAIALGRRNFVTFTAPEVKVTAGQTVALNGPLEQSARDLSVATSVPGARILIDGKEVGTTAASSDPAGPSRPIVVPSLPPGPHAIVALAPCYRRLEQSVELELDAQDLGPKDVGVLALQRARAVLSVTWDATAGGTLAIDGQPAKPGVNEVCPGEHEVSLTLGGRRAWFEVADVKEDETVPLVPQPRPAVGIVRDAAGFPLPGFPGKAWNELRVTPAAGEALLLKLAPWLRANAVPVFPGVARVALADSAAATKAAAPEADLVALALPGNDPIRPTRVLALFDTRRDLVEVTGWVEKDADAAAALVRELSRPLRCSVPYTGVDLADRAGRPPVVARVESDSPAAAAGLAAGQTVVSVNGKPLAGLADFAPLEDAATADAPLVLRVSDAAGEREVRIVPVANVWAPNPAALRGQPGLLLLPLIARAELARVAGAPAERVGCAALVGFALAATGQAADAAAALDRAVIDDALDPAQDARGTVAYVLERLLRRIGRADYAAEVHARWVQLDRARLGGRSGPPLRAAQDLREE